MVRDGKVAVTRIAVAVIITVSIAFGATGIYYYTAPQGGSGAPRTSSTPSIAPAGGTSGYQDSNGQPFGAWTQYLGYIPKGYVVALHQSNAPTFPCPAELSPSACAQFQQSCGNGVCDPNESCSSCPIDCAPTGNLLCDPYTGRPGTPASVCQAAVAANQGPP